MQPSIVLARRMASTEKWSVENRMLMRHLRFPLQSRPVTLQLHKTVAELGNRRAAALRATRKIEQVKYRYIYCAKVVKNISSFTAESKRTTVTVDVI